MNTATLAAAWNRLPPAVRMGWKRRAGHVHFEAGRRGGTEARAAIAEAREQAARQALRDWLML
jgi:hypothetical protein